MDFSYQQRSIGVQMSPLFSQGSQSSQDDYSMGFSSSQIMTDEGGGEAGVPSGSGEESGDSKKRKRTALAPGGGGGGGLRATVTPQFSGATGDSGFTFLGGSVGGGGNWLELGPTPFSQGGGVGAFGGKSASGGPFKAPMKPFRRPGESSSGPSQMAPPQRRYPSSQSAVGRVGAPSASYYEQNNPRYRSTHTHTTHAHTYP